MLRQIRSVRDADHPKQLIDFEQVSNAENLPSVDRDGLLSNRLWGLSNRSPRAKLVEGV
jgi:hypothetical protein